MNEYLKINREKLDTPMAMNERSFSIWHREKFLKEEQGKKILKRCGLSSDTLNIYETMEPEREYFVPFKTLLHAVSIQGEARRKRLFLLRLK